MIVEIRYSNCNKKINEYMLNILKQKTNWADFLTRTRYNKIVKQMKNK